MQINTKEEFDESMKLTKRFFIVSGFEMGEPKYKFLQWLYFFNIIFLFVDVFGEFSWLVEGLIMGKSLEDVSMIAPCFTICLMSTSKIVPFAFNKQTFQKAVKKLRAIHPDERRSENIERKIVIESQKFLKSVLSFFSISTMSVTVVFTTTPCLLMGYEYYTTGVLELKLPFLIKYFFDVYANTTIYSIIYVHQIWSTVTVCVNLISTDSFFYIYCTYLRMHFRILGHRFQNVVTASREDTRDNLRKCVQRHQELTELVNLLEILYSKSLLCNIVFSTILLCLSGFNIMVVQKISTVLRYGPFLVMSLTQVFLVCYFGDLLMGSSIQISDAVYSCRWYDAEPDIRKCVLIIIIRSQKPCKVTAGNFLDLNLATFTSILSRSWSCFALLKTMYT